MRRLILGLSVIGLQFGCGVDTADMGTQPELASREDQLYRCLSESLIVYYSDATLTTSVGTERCYCGRTPTLTGVRSDFWIENYSYECPG